MDRNGRTVCCKTHSYAVSDGEESFCTEAKEHIIPHPLLSSGGVLTFYCVAFRFLIVFIIIKENPGFQSFLKPFFHSDPMIRCGIEKKGGVIWTESSE